MTLDASQDASGLDRLRLMRITRAIPMRLDSSKSKRLPRPGRVGGWIRNVVMRLTGRDPLLRTSRAEFEQVARDLDLSHPELYGLLTGQSITSDALEQKLAALAIASTHLDATQPAEKPQLSASAQAWLPIGPSCC